MKMVKYSNNYEDITEDMKKTENNNLLEPKYVCKYIKEMENGAIIIYDESNSKFDKKKHNDDELRTIYTLRNLLCWNIEILFRVNKDGISTPDIRRICDTLEYWDIKNIYKSKTLNSRKSKLKHRITKQCNNFVFDINNDMCDLTNEEAIEQIAKIYFDYQCRHVDKIILIGKNNFIKCFKRK